MRDLKGPGMCVLAGVFGACGMLRAQTLESPSLVETNEEAPLTLGVCETTTADDLLAPSVHITLALSDLFATSKAPRNAEATLDVESDLLFNLSESITSEDVETSLGSMRLEIGEPSPGLFF